MFKQIFESVQHYHTHLYTNGSKLNHVTAAAVYIPSKNRSIQHRLPDNTSIYVAELSAIKIAIQWLFHYGVIGTTAVLFSNSLSILRPSIDTPVPRYPQHRVQQVACIRLGSDHTLLAANAHKFNMHDTGLCPCGKSQTTTNIFFDQTCYIYQNKRLTFLNKIYTIKPHATLTDILNNSKLLYIAADYILHATGQV